jgi:hypothetical protein
LTGVNYQREKALSKEYQQLKINISFSAWKKTLGIKQGRPKKIKKNKQ